MPVLRHWMIDEGGLAPLIVLIVFVVVAFVAWVEVRQRRRFEDELVARRGKLPCIHRFVRMVFVHTADGKLKDRYPQCVDCGERVLKNVIFMEED